MNPNTEKKKRGVWHYIVLVLFVLGLGYAFVVNTQHHTATIQLDTHELFVEVANTPKQRFLGLSNRETLAPYDGMLFLFNYEGQHAFVMRDMLFDLDIIWLHGNRVIDFVQHAKKQPNVDSHELIRYYPRDNATAVLEVPAGWIQKHPIQVGSILTVIDE